MNNDEIIHMAKEAGYYTDDQDVYDGSNFFIHTKEITKFAELVAAHERQKFCVLLRQLHDSFSLASEPSGFKPRGNDGN